MARVAGSKGLQPVTVRLEDGTHLLRAYRPVPGEFSLLERQVRVTGVVSSGANPDPMVQQVVAPSVRPEHIELCPGEAPYPPGPSGEVPVPPLASDGGGLVLRAGLWVRARGRLAGLEAPENDPFWGTATLELADGARVSIPTTPTGQWDGRLGQELIVTGQLAWWAPDPADPYTLLGPTRLEDTAL